MRFAGTAGFRAPEAQVDERSDVYALGALLRFLTVEDPPALLRAVAARAMSAAPSASCADAAELLADVAQFEDGLAIEAWCEPIWHRMRRFAARNAALLAIGGVCGSKDGVVSGAESLTLRGLPGFG